MSSPVPPLPSTTPRRRLSARRGSISAPDPFAKHTDLNRSLSSSSTLTIVRVINNGNNNNNYSDAFTLQEPPSGQSPAGRRHGSQHHQQHRRIGSNSSDNGGNGRLSFAFTSFGGPARSTSPTSPRRPASPGRHHSLPQSQPRLTPDQLYDLAHQAINPNYAPSPRDASQSPYRPESPHRPVSPSYFRRSPVMHPVNPSPVTAPATFTPLPPSIFLPFIDRPSEVAALISSAPTKKLFALLRQTFPRDPSSPGADSGGSSSPHFPPLQSQITESPVSRDPATWTYPQLMTFLTTTTRSDMPDTLWVAKIRKCILSRSELIWERVKGALGVPPELDIDANFLEDTEMHADVFESSSGSEGEEEVEQENTARSRPATVRTATDDMEDFGRKARGHWDDWDAVLSSPEVERTRAQAQFPNPARLSSPSATETDEVSTMVAPTPRQTSPPEEKPLELPLITEQVPTPDETFPNKGHSKSASAFSLSPSDFDLMSSPVISPSGVSESQLIIEPLLSPSASKSPVPGTNPPPLSLPSSLASESPSASTGALGDIIEGEEDEEEEGKEEKEKTSDSPTTHSDDSKSEPVIDPSHIHGLRISLPGTPVTPTANWRDIIFAQTQSTSSSSSPVEQTTSRRPWSVGSASGVAGLTRTGSTGSVKSLGSVGSRRQSYINSHGYGEGTHFTTGSDGGYESDGIGYDPVGDRAPGNPLFPSNFARLATGPTLAANNPSIRSPPIPPASKYHPLLHSSSLRGRFTRRGSRGSASGASDYAITFGSGSIAGDN